MRAIRADKLFGRPHDHRTHNLTLLHRSARRSYLYRRDDNIANKAVSHARATQNSDAHDLFRAGVVGHLESRLLLNHGYLSSPRLTISTISQHLVLLSGRVSPMRTTSPM